MFLRPKSSNPQKWYSDPPSACQSVALCGFTLHCVVLPLLFRTLHSHHTLFSFWLFLPSFLSGLCPKADGPCKQMLPTQSMWRKNKAWMQSKQNLLEGTHEIRREVHCTINPRCNHGSPFYRQVERTHAGDYKNETYRQQSLLLPWWW